MGKRIHNGPYRAVFLACQVGTRERLYRVMRVENGVAYDLDPMPNLTQRQNAGDRATNLNKMYYGITSKRQRKYQRLGN